MRQNLRPYGHLTKAFVIWAYTMTAMLMTIPTVVFFLGIYAIISVTFGIDTSGFQTFLDNLTGR